MLNIFKKQYALTNNKMFFYDLQTIQNQNKKNKLIEHVIINNNTISFEKIVELLSRLEDNYGSSLKSLSINCSYNKKIFFELLDFYNVYDLQINIIADEIMSPFKIIHDIFSVKEIDNLTINSFSNYGICMNLSKLNLDVWLDESVYQIIGQYTNCAFDTQDFYIK